jgi:hypothetical protein
VRGPTHIFNGDRDTTDAIFVFHNDLLRATYLSICNDFIRNRMPVENALKRCDFHPPYPIGLKSFIKLAA